jgi:hypothetical protein
VSGVAARDRRPSVCATVLGGALALWLVEAAGEEKAQQAVRDFSTWGGKVRGNLFLIAGGMVVPGGRGC